MEYKKLLMRFYGRLLAEALLLSGVQGLICGAGAVFILSFVYHLLLTAPPVRLVIGVFLGCFGLGFLWQMLLRYPTASRIAARLDEMGLQERAGTMLAFAKDHSTMARLQRKDAQAHIAKVSPKEIPFRFRKKQALVCLIAVVLAVAMLLLPANAFSPNSGMSAQEAARAQAVAELIDQMRQQVADAKLPSELEKTLNDILDQLEQALLATDNQLEQAILIDQAMQQMQSATAMVLSRYQIGTALQRFELTRTLGQQVCEGDTIAIPLTLDELEIFLVQTAANITKLSNNISLALEDCGIAPQDPLYMAFEYFARNIAHFSYAMNQTPEEEDFGITPEPNDPEAMAEVFNQAEALILAALDEQAVLEAEMDTLHASLQQSSQSLLDDKQEGAVQQAPGQGCMDMTGQVSSGGGNASAGTAGGMAQGPSNSTQTTMLEGIYDPISGSVTYGEVFSAYYAQYLQALDAGEIPEDLQKLIDQYYSALS